MSEEKRVIFTSINKLPEFTILGRHRSNIDVLHDCGLESLIINVDGEMVYIEMENVLPLIKVLTRMSEEKEEYIKYNKDGEVI